VAVVAWTVTATRAVAVVAVVTPSAGFL